MEEKVQNTQMEVPNTTNMNDRDYLNVALELEKNMSNNLSIALNEMSNEELCEKMLNIFLDVKKSARDTFELMFCKGWYTLEKAEENKKEEKITELTNKLEQLSNQ